ncbi:PREDICTED: uncharacterized protein LOC108369387 isoform X2 [Rhagoletis zephyria]|nr:PREDICTED: uncharacterized protein LOC108369387 isoform X2 [Rhagoletis zephyria]
MNKSKSTNKHQLEILVNLMQSHAEIARGFYKGGKEPLNRFWRKVEKELNSAGPPSKCIAEWKKVWADQKKYVRHKAASNLRHSRGTGGGPNIEYKFSATERAIFELIGMKESVEGVAKTFGLTSSINVERVEENLDFLMNESGVVNEIVLKNECVAMNEDPMDCVFLIDEEEPTYQPSSKAVKPTSSKKVLTKHSPPEILVEEVAIHRELCDTIKGAVSESKEQQENVKKIYRAIDSMQVVQKKHFKEMEKLKREEIDEMKRHNLIMEELMLRQLEK